MFLGTSAEYTPLPPENSAGHTDNPLLAGNSLHNQLLLLSKLLDPVGQALLLHVGVPGQL